MLAYYDSLTRLPNRVLFCEHLAREIAMGRREPKDIAVLFLDLDNFKRVNDSLGHAYGDLYQPQLNLETGKLESVEALVRWNNDELGFVSPGDFIPLAEDTGLIVPIGEWVLSTACKQAVEWIEAGVPLQRIAVNISVLEFVSPDFLTLVANTVSESGLDPKMLELEITESVLADDTFSAVDSLTSLKELGHQLSIDDFGTGFSSLSQLKHFQLTA